MRPQRTSRVCWRTTLAAHPGAWLRLGHLRLLIEMLGSERRDSAFLTSTEYQAEVERRRARGEEHPDESTLRAAYGHWLASVQAATSFLFGGGVHASSTPTAVRTTGRTTTSKR